MEKVRKYLKYPHRSIWIRNNPDTLFVTYDDLIEKLWEQVTIGVNKNNHGIVLMNNDEMVGVIISETFLSKYYDEYEIDKAVDPIRSISEYDLKSNRNKCLRHLRSGENLIILDKGNKPIFSIACREFAFMLRTDKNSVIRVNEDLSFDNNDYDINDLII